MAYRLQSLMPTELQKVAMISVLKLHACSFVGRTIEFIVNIIYSDTPLFLSHGISEITLSILMALVVPQLLVI